MDILSLTKLIAGKQDTIQLHENTLVLGSAKLGGASGTEITKAILDNLINLQNGSDFANATNAHTHDGRYFTEAELGATTNPSGASKIGVNFSPTNYSAGTQDVEAHLAGINSAFGNISINSFNDSTFNIYNNDDNTKLLNFALASIGTGTTRTITMPNANVNLGALTNANIDAAAAIDYSKLNLAGSIVNADINASAAIAYSKLNLSASIVNADVANGANIALAKLAALTASRALVSDGSGVISVSAVTATELGSLTGISGNIQSQINNLSSSIQSFEWLDSALSIELDSANIVAPATGDRYLIAGVGANDFLGEDNKVAEWDGAEWVFTTPTTGAYISVDDEADGLYNYGGSSWSKKYFESTTASTGLEKVGFDIRLASSSAGDGILFTSGVLSVRTDGESTQISGGEVVVKLNGAGAIIADASGVAVQLESSNPTLVIASNRLGVKLDAAGAVVTGASGVAVAVDGSTIEISSNALRIKAVGVQASHVNTNVFDQTSITGGNGVAAAVVSAPLMRTTLTAGESFAANTSFLVRWALTGETAGRVYKADKDASVTSKYFAIGIALSGAGASAGSAITVITLGTHTLGSSDTPFSGADVGKELYVGAAGAFILGSALANTTGEAQVCIGSIQSTTQIWVTGPQVRGIA